MEYVDFLFILHVCIVYLLNCFSYETLDLWSILFYH